MNSKRIQLLLAVVVAWISLFLMMTTTYGASIVIGGNYVSIDRTVIVSPKKGDTPKTNGTALLNILTGITPDGENPYLLKLGPGIYDIGTGNLHMKGLVDVEGSGVNVTTIMGNPSSNGYCDPGAAVVYGTSYAEIRSLTVRNVGASGAYAVGILNASNGSLAMKDMSVSVNSPGAAFNFGVVNCNAGPLMLNVDVEAYGSPGINRGIYNTSQSSPSMMNVDVSASGGVYADGIRNEDSGMVLRNSRVSANLASASYGVSNAASSSPPWIEIQHSRLFGDTYGILNGANGAVVYSEIYGGVSNSGYIICIGSYNLDHQILSPTCQ